jgi:UDP-N-acetylglucosamine 4-epimerase
MEVYKKINMDNLSLYNEKFHNQDLTNYRFLITGGAGFIGSNIVEYLLKYNACHVRVLDNLSNGYLSNIEEFNKFSNFEFINGDIRDYNTCVSSLDQVDIVFHQAALGSVPRSITDPITSNDVNITGFLNMLLSSQRSKSIKKFIYAASSSTFGDSIELPKIEGNEGKPLSPYAVTKAVNEMYGDVFSKVYNFHTVGLRYFNVFGPKQNPANPYAAVIPLFCKNHIEGKASTINGDGKTSRDFTFVENVVQANIKAAFSEFNTHQIFNVACGNQISLNEVISILNKISKKTIYPYYSEERIGDIKHSMASIKKIQDYLNYIPFYSFQMGLEYVYSWYLRNFDKPIN